MNDAPPTLIEDFYDKFLDLAAGELGRQEIAEVTEILEKYLPEIA